jgi:hypothetical protein
MRIVSVWLVVIKKVVKRKFIVQGKWQILGIQEHFQEFLHLSRFEDALVKNQVVKKIIANAIVQV